MSRLHASVQQRPPFEFPRAPLSPPDTNDDSLGTGPHPSSLSVIGAIDPKLGEIDAHSSQPILQEIPTSRFRRGPSIAYHSSGLRESREKTVQRSPKTFVIVIPPARLAQERGQLGHTLAVGPAHRLGHGILMPLFPTMYAQLTAIAREFNFPSTTGLCLYFHFTENGVTMTPRVSDEHWHHIWAYALDATATAHRPPISGKIEFDVDLHQARWYGSWLSSSHREHVDFPISANHSPAPSIAHLRGDSRTTLADVLLGEEQPDSRLPTIISRHGPRKLSLVDRFDSVSIRSISRPASRGHSPPESHPIAHALSPIFQEEEPKTAKYDLESRVKSWRASAVPNSSTLAANGQTSLEPPNLPNNVPLNDDLPVEDQALRLEDFAWSVSSVGPNDFDPESDSAPFYSPLPSPDIAHRMYEDCPPTPSTMTSWGPLSYTFSDDGYASERVPSIDLGHRGVFSRPVTPETMTSWGAPSISWPPSPASQSFSYSIHLAHRVEFSRPVTPISAASWGPEPITWPPAEGDTEISFHLDSFPVTPSTTLSWEPLGTLPSSDRMSDDEPVSGVDNCLGQEESEIERSTHFEDSTGLYHLPLHYPALIICPPVYPHFELYPPVSVTQEDESEGYPHFNLYPPCNSVETKQGLVWNHVWPYLAVNRSADQPWKPATHPSQPWKQVWPYSTVNQPSQPWKFVWPYNSTNVNDTHVQSTYPNLVIYPPVYPFFDLYPAPAGVESEDSQHVRAISAIPEDNPTGSSSQVAGVASNYPIFNIYPPVYPFIVPYPVAPFAEECSMLEAHQPLESRKEKEVLPLTSHSYPSFNIYPAVYPYFDIYPSLLDVPRSQGASPSPQLQATTTGTQVGLHDATLAKAGYPSFNIYPPVYPHFNLYPAVAVDHVQSITSASATSCSGYPHIEPYPPAFYPHFNVYPPMAASDNRVSIPAVDTIQIAQPDGATQFPCFNLYPPVYPYFQLYPPRAASYYPKEFSSPIPPASTVKRTTESAGRLTHSELHAPVTTEIAQATGSFGSEDKYQVLEGRSHENHEEVSPSGVRSTPSGRYLDEEAKLIHARRLSNAHSARPMSMASRRPPPRAPLPSTPSPRKTSSPSLISTARLSTAYEHMSALMIESGLSPEKEPVPRRPPLSNSGLARRVSPSSDQKPVASPLRPSSMIPNLSRSSSLALPRNPRPAVEQEHKVNRSVSSSSPRPLPKRRDSVVLQRVRELDSSTAQVVDHRQKEPSRTSLTPRALDRSRYPPTS